MTSPYSTVGVHEVNKWVWECLKADLPDDFTAYTTPGATAYGERPIVPSAQTPETNNIEGGAPFIVYVYTLTGANDEWWWMAENVVYTIYDSDEPRLRRIHNYLNHLLRRVDHTADEINAFLGDSRFDVKRIILTGGSGADPVIAEGGRHACILTFRVDYTVEIDGSVRSTLGNRAGMRT